MERRLDRLAKVMGAGEPEGGMLQVVDTTRWPVADQARYRAGTPAERAAMIELHTGCPMPPPGRGIRMVVDVAPDPLHPARDLTEIW